MVGSKGSKDMVSISLFPIFSAFHGGSHAVEVGSSSMGGNWSPAVSTVLGTLLTERGKKRQRKTEREGQRERERERASLSITQTNPIMSSHWHNLDHMSTQEPGWAHSTHVDEEWRRYKLPKGNQSAITQRRGITNRDWTGRTDVFNKCILRLHFCNILLNPFSCCCSHVFYSDLYTVLLFSCVQGKRNISGHF